MRIDTYLWKTRLYKTRTLSTKACRNNQVCIQDCPQRASKQLYGGEVITIDKNGFHYKVRVLDLPKQRLSAKIVAEYYEDLTDPTQFEQRKQTAQVQTRISPRFLTEKERKTGSLSKKKKRQAQEIWNQFES